MTHTFQAIPTNLITGFLGSGKTTAILQLLKSKPEGSHWAVLVNEFGEVGIDGALLEQEGMNEGVYIKEVPGGCLCCAAGLPLQMALNLLIKKAQPDRLLIEPTGVGHPKKVIDTLTGEFYKSVLDVRSSICLVEAPKLMQEKYLDNETFMDQLNIADVLLASKADQSTPEELENFHQFSQSFVLPKSQIDIIEFGQFSTEFLDIERNTERSVDFPEAHSKSEPIHHHDQLEKENASATTTENSCDWRRFENNGQGYYGCGWIFNKCIIFDEARLKKWVEQDTFSRVKGIFNTNEGWLLFNRTEKQLSQEEATHISDSRVELIESEYHDWNLVEEELLECIDKFL